MSTASTHAATIEDLYRVEGKAELIGGRIVHFMASGDLPADIAFDIGTSLRAYAKANGGKGHGDGVGFALDLPLPNGRQSFQPDASYYVGPLPVNRMRFIDGTPTFAVEVRSENDYGSGAELEIAANRDDYFQAGTLAIWDVDPIAETVTLYRTSDPTTGITFRRGDIADAEPAVPGWRMPVDTVFSV